MRVWRLGSEPGIKIAGKVSEIKKNLTVHFVPWLNVQLILY
jgi:hypothetical protein